MNIATAPITYSLQNHDDAARLLEGRSTIYFLSRAFIEQCGWNKKSYIDGFRPARSQEFAKRNHDMTKIIEADIPFIMAQANITEYEGKYGLSFMQGNHRTAFLYARGRDEVPIFIHFPNADEQQVLDGLSSKGLIREATPEEKEQIARTALTLRTDEVQQKLDNIMFAKKDGWQDNIMFNRLKSLVSKNEKN